MAARVYTMVPALERLDNTCLAFSKVYGPNYDEAYPDRPVGEFERRALKRAKLAGGREIAVDLTYRDPEQQSRRRLAAASLQEVFAFGNPSVEINEYPHGDGQMARYVYARETEIVVVNDYPFADGEARPLEGEEIEALRDNFDTVSIYDGEFMARTLTPKGQERLIADLMGLLAVDGYVLPLLTDETP